MHLSGSGAPRFPPRCRPMKPLTEDELRDELNNTNTTADVRSSRPTSGGAVTQRACTCHPDDSPPKPCAQRYALGECQAYQCGRDDAMKWADATWSETVRQTRAFYQDKLDALGVAIANAGYTWTTEMREAYEMPLVGASSIKTISTNRKIKACLAIAEDGTYCVYGYAGKMNEEDKSLNKSVVSQGLEMYDLTYYDVQFEVPIPTNKSLVLSPDSITKEEE